MSRCTPFLLLAALLFTLPICAQHAVHYELRFPNRVHHEAEIRATFSEIATPVLQVMMSRSSPGRYALHEFAKNIYHVHATDSQGRPLPLAHPNTFEWDVSGHDGAVSFEYTLFGDTLDGTYDAIDDTQAHLNLPATLAWAHGFEDAPATLKFDIPENSNWTAATQLIPQPDGTWSASNLEWLMDSPVELSAHAMREWKSGSTTFRISLHSNTSEADAPALENIAKKILPEEEAVFGQFPHYDNGTYTFLIDDLPYGSVDGMEHRDSCVIVTPGTGATPSGPRIVDILAHEFFHSWNVKRIRPKSLEPFDFERANMSDELWFAEGFTQYYGSLVLKRAAVSGLDDFLQEMAGAINSVLNAPGRDVFSAVGMSERAPFVDAAKPVDQVNFRNTYISYYSYGEALALGIDLALREQFPGKTLDHWMRKMWAEHPDANRPYALADLQNALAETTGSTNFAHAVFTHHISGMQPMDYAELLKPAGLLLQKAHPGAAWVGRQSLQFSKDGAEIGLGTVVGTPLYDAGLDRGDHILSWDGKVLKSQGELQSWLKTHKPGDRVRLAVETRSGKHEVTAVIGEDPTLEILTFEKAQQPVTAEITEFRRAWLGPHAAAPQQ